MVVALAISAGAIGDVERFEQSQKLVSYLGLNPSVRQSGPAPAYHGRITKQGRGHARGMLVEAAWAAARARRVPCVRSSCRSAPAALASRRCRDLVALGAHLAFAEQSGFSRRRTRAARLGDGKRGANAPRIATAARPTRTISRAIAIRSADGSSRPRRPTRFVSGWNPRSPQRAARAPWPSATVKAARQGLRLAPCSSPRGRPCAGGK